MRDKTKEVTAVTLGELRKLTEHLSDDVEIITNESIHEMRGSKVKARGIRLMKVRKENQTFKDDFDGTSYSVEVFVPDQDGEEMLYI